MSDAATPSDAAGDEPKVVELADTTAIATKRDLSQGILVLIAVMLLGILVLQFLQLQQGRDTTAEVAALAEDVTDLKPLRRDVDILGDQLAALDGQVDAALNEVGASPAAIPSRGTDGSLPAFEDSSNDPAVLGGMKLSSISGPEYYSQAETTFAPTDGKARAWLVWAHWCPYCQAELPDLAEWYPENASRFPNVELVTVTSAIDETRGNPLEPYLDDGQFPFPVVVDESGALSQLFGTTAFPFWVITDAEGTVVLRIAGAVGTDSIDQIFAQLETMTSGA